MRRFVQLIPVDCSHPGPATRHPPALNDHVLIIERNRTRNDSHLGGLELDGWGLRRNEKNSRRIKFPPESLCLWLHEACNPTRKSPCLCGFMKPVTQPESHRVSVAS
ncbi:hypothetical protein RRG08_020230 [Elysia crispata]|uniref:Uncharacterized protein n=1 Tax=Elysia crispata TaxID=231223 RepID=A0AAE1A2C7_9GAST|nr:hypothetical protein RRG08_020230 [Elysia crispata]